MQSDRPFFAVYPSRSALLRVAFVCAMLALVLCLLAFAPAPQHQRLSASEAKDHIGETATVCGNVVSTRYAASTNGHPTFLNLDKAYPNQIFTVLIWGSNRSKFGTPEIDYKAKRVCATGKITEYRGTAETVANEPRQLKVE